MQLIEPCCTQKHWPALRRSLGENGTRLFCGFGDLSIDELMSVILNRYSETDMMIVAPTIPDRAATAMLAWLKKRWGCSNGTGPVNMVERLTVIADLGKEASPTASQWLTENPYPNRLIPYNIQQRDTAILLPDLAIYGNINLAYGSRFTAFATKDMQIIGELRRHYTEMTAKAT